MSIYEYLGRMDDGEEEEEEEVFIDEARSIYFTMMLNTKMMTMLNESE